MRALKSPSSSACRRSPARTGRRSGLLPLFCILLSLAGAPASEHGPIQTLDRLADAAYRPGGTPADYRQPSMEELLSWEQLVSRLIDQAGLPTARLYSDLQARGRALGYGLEAVQLGETTVWVLREEETAGGGLFVIRTGPAEPLFVQAVHMRNDKYSERCATRAFWASQARLLCISTLSRDSVPPATGARYGPADMSHQEHSHITAATRAAARTLADLVVLQFHGFGQEARGLGPRVVIASNGTRSPDTSLFACARTLGQLWQPVDLLIYPDDITVLGGLLNAQGRVLMRFPQHQFIHLEMSLPLRQELIAGDPSRFDLREALAPALRPNP